MSMLERHPARLRRLDSCQDREDLDCLTLNSWQPSNPDTLSFINATTDETSAVITSNRRFHTSPNSVSQCNSSLINRGESSIVTRHVKKRKSKFDDKEKERNNVFDTEEPKEEDRSDITVKTEKESRSKGSLSKGSEIPMTDYIHVRARRGQATDSHSLAERARREKISKRMKCLQDLVPSCSKVTGKAGVLDEIINYVQSLQKQVEFISMKLAVANPSLGFDPGDFLTQEALAYISTLPEAPQLTSTNSTCTQYNEMQRGSSSQVVNPPFDQSQYIHRNHENYSTTLPEMLLDSSDWPYLFNPSFHF